MNPETALLWWWLGILTRRRYELLLNAFGDLETAFTALSPELLKQLRCKDDTIKSTLARINAFDPDRYKAEMEERGVTLLTIEDHHYPALLKEIPDAPVFLSYIGDLSVLDHPTIAIVGTRNMTKNGQRAVEHFVPSFIRTGVTTVSGLALGVDTVVAKQTLIANGKTVAVLGNGLASIFPPANARLAEEIIANGGLIVSEFALEFPPDKYTFPSRNRIIAGLSLGTLVIEAPEESGSIITAELAADYNRDVFAVPGLIFDESYAGCNQLIATGQAQLVNDPNDVLQTLGLVPADLSHARTFISDNPIETLIYQTLSGMPQSLDDLMVRTHLDASQIGVALTMMELAGAVKNVGGGQWVRT